MSIFKVSILCLSLGLPAVCVGAEGKSRTKLVVVKPGPVTVKTLADAKAVTNVHRHVLLPFVRNRCPLEYQRIFKTLSEKEGIVRIRIERHVRAAHVPGETLDRLQDFPSLRHLEIFDSLSQQDPAMWEAIGKVRKLETLNAVIR